MSNVPSTEDLLLGQSWRQLFDCETWRVDYLVHYAECDDTSKRDRARILLSGLRRRASRHKLCRLAIDQERGWLNDLIGATDFLPEVQVEIPKFLALTRQWARYLNEVGTVRPLIRILSEASDSSARLSKNLAQISEPAGIKLLLDLYCEASSLPANEEDSIKATLISQKSPDCIQTIFSRWAQQRNPRLVSIINELNAAELNDVRIELLAALKLNKPVSLPPADITLLLDCLDDEDPQISEAARKTLLLLDRNGGGVMSKDFFERLCANPTDSFLQVSSQLSSRPEQICDRVLFCALTGNLGELSQIDPEGVVLGQVYRNGSASGRLTDGLKSRLFDFLRSSAKSEWVNNVFGVKEKLRLSTMTDLDWHLLQNALSASSSWDELWRLVHLAPALSARRLLRRLTQVGWRPEAKEDLLRFEKLQYFAKRISSEHIPLWSGIEYLGSIEIGSPLFGGRGDVGVASLENRFGFSSDGSSFFFADFSGAVKMWHLPSLLSSTFVVDDVTNVCSIALSYSNPLIACSDLTNTISVCDLLENRVVAKCTLPESRANLRVGNLRFSESGNYLTGNLLQPQRNVPINGIMWDARDFSLEPQAIPQGATISSDDELLLYRTHGAIHLTRLDRKSALLDHHDTFFRVRGADFLPDASAIVLYERAKVHLHNVRDFERVHTASLQQEQSTFIFDQAQLRWLSLHEDYSFGFSTINSAKIAHEFQTQSHKQFLSDNNVLLSSVHDRGAASPGRSVLQLHSDARKGYLAILHAAGTVSFWASPFSKLSCRPPLHFTQVERDQIRLSLMSSRLSESELAWLRFISELSGSLEHYAVELADSDAITFSDFEIELV